MSNCMYAEAYAEPCQVPKINPFANIVRNKFKIRNKNSSLIPLMSLF